MKLLKLFQSIFTDRATPGNYPPALVEQAIERAVESTDPRIRALSGYSKRLRAPVELAIDHIVALVDSLPEPLPLTQAQYAADARLAALFASIEHMREVLVKDPMLTGFLQGEGMRAPQVVALLMAEMQEKGVLGMAMNGDMVQRDVAQVVVNFSAHRLLDPRENEAETRKLLRRRAFDHLLTLALGRMVEQREERTDLLRQRELLNRKLAALQRGGWSFEQEEAAGSLEALAAELADIETQIAAVGSPDEVLNVHLELLADTLATPQSQLWGQPLTLRLDRMNIRRDQDAELPGITLQALHNAHGRRLVALMVAIDPAELPPREHYLDVAQRYLI